MYYVFKILEGLAMCLLVLIIVAISVAIGVFTRWLFSFVVDTHLDMFIGMVVSVLAFFCMMLKVDI